MGYSLGDNLPLLLGLIVGVLSSLCEGACLQALPVNLLRPTLPEVVTTARAHRDELIRLEKEFTSLRAEAELARQSH